MTLEEQLKQEILGRYKSVRAFTTSINIPYSTLDSVFKRGIANAGVSTMIKVFDALDLDIESIAFGELRHRDTDKKASGTTEAAPERKQFTLEESNRLLVAMGFIEEGQDLSDDDLAFLTHIIGLLNSYFSKRGLREQMTGK